MRTLGALAILVLSVAGSDCAPKPEPVATDARGEVTVPVGQSFRLGYGKEAMLAGGNLRIRFDTVSEDSRCPGGKIQCVWAGNARVVLQLSAGGQPAARDTVSLSLEPRTVTYDGYLIHLDDLQPAPTSEEHPRPESYVATLTVTRRGG
jgi:hypothetical protein